MPGFLRPYEAQVYALLRIVTGFLFLWHGMQKVLSWPVPRHGEAPAFVTWIAGPIELVGGLLVMIGLFAGWAAFLSSGLMAFAYFLGHANQGFLPLINKGELAALYCFVFLYIAARGSGIWSVDSVRGPSRDTVTVAVRAPGARATGR
jgi:putative oxidoreductase